jgi:hypothetical protein
MNLTLIVIPIEEVSDVRLVNSFVPAYFKRLHKNRFFNVMVKTEWKMFMYADEVLSKNLKKALPIVCERGKEFDYFSFYKLIKKDEKLKYSMSPRLFKSDIEMRDNSVYPIDIDSLKGITILDGYILGQ